MRFYIVDLERTFANKKTVYWKTGKKGYTDDKKEAGTYLYENALALCQNDILDLTLILPCDEDELER